MAIKLNIVENEKQPLDDFKNDEITEKGEPGRENIEIFGLEVADVEGYKSRGDYFAWDEYNRDRDRLGRVVDELVDGTFARLSGDFSLIHDGLMHQNDADFVLKDFRPYVSAWEHLGEVYGDRRRWNRMALANTANSGFFSSDRTIREYAEDIWHV